MPIVETVPAAPALVEVELEHDAIAGDIGDTVAVELESLIVDNAS